MNSVSVPPKISLEFTTPSNPIAEKNILDAAQILQQFKTDFSCFNFGGGHISSERAMMMIDKFHDQFQMPVSGYLRRSHVDRIHFDALVSAYEAANIHTIFLTEGRRLNSTPKTTAHYPSLIDAITALKKRNSNLKIMIEARPEHNRDEIKLMEAVIDAGVDEIITRFSFNAETTLRFLDKLNAYGTLPIIRIGVMPFENPSKTFLTAHRLNVQIPQFIQKLFNDYPEYDEVNTSISAHILLGQVQNYMQAGYHHFHIRFGRSHNAIEALCRFFNIQIRKINNSLNTEPLSNLEKCVLAS